MCKNNIFDLSTSLRLIEDGWQLVNFSTCGITSIFRWLLLIKIFLMYVFISIQIYLSQFIGVRLQKFKILRCFLILFGFHFVFYDSFKVLVILSVCESIEWRHLIRWFDNNLLVLQQVNELILINHFINSSFNFLLLSTILQVRHGVLRHIFS